MGDRELASYFENYLAQSSIFLDKSVLASNYTPDSISHRDEQIQAIADVLAPSLRVERPSNLFIYGKTGSGKTVSVQHTTRKMLDVASKRSIPLRVLYLNCKLKKVADTEYRLMAHLCREFGKEIPATGLPTDEIYKIFFSCIDSQKQIVLLILDEIDQLVKKTGDEILYNLTRMNSEMHNAQVCMVGISNDLVFADYLDPRVKSSLSEEELVFPPYNALQIQDILRKRATRAFAQGSVMPGVIEKCAAYAAREHGDVRRAIELLRVAAELAERRGSTTVELSHIDGAEDKIEHDRIVDLVITQPKQHQATLYAVLCTKKPSDSSMIFTGEVYELYKKICQQCGLRPLTQRRVSDIICELDMLGIINAKVISKGRYGRTREIVLSLSDSLAQKVREILGHSLAL